MNQEVMRLEGWGNRMLIIVGLVLAVVLYSQWLQARHLNLLSPAHINHQGTTTTTLKPLTSDGTDGSVSVTHSSDQSGNGQVNDSSTDIDVSSDGDSITVTNSNHQESHGGDVESDSGSTSSGSQSNSSSSHTTVTHNGQVIVDE